MGSVSLRIAAENESLRREVDILRKEKIRLIQEIRLAYFEGLDQGRAQGILKEAC